MNQNILSFIKEQFKSIGKRIEQKDPSLAGEIRLLSKLFDEIRLSETINKAEERQITGNKAHKTKAGTQKPVQIFKELFSNSPDKQFDPAELRDVLKEKQSRNELLTNSNDLLSLTHTVLRVLSKSRYIEKIQHADKPRYKFIKQDSLL